MKLYVIFGQRHESYEGEYAPEVWDEYSVDENPEGYETALEAAEGNDNFRAVRAIVVNVDEGKIARLLRDLPELDGEVEEPAV